MTSKKPTAKQLEALLEASKLLNSTLESQELLLRLLDRARVFAASVKVQ